jgi:hypothetical protein
LEVGWSSNLLVGSLVDEIVWNNTLSDHLCFHDNVFVVIKIVLLNLFSDFVKLLIGWMSSVVVLESIDPLDVLALLLISQGLEGFECLQVNWLIVAFLALALLFCFQKELVQFSFSLGSVEACSERVELIHGFILILNHKVHKGILVGKNLLSLLLMLLDGVGEVSLTLLIEFLLLLADIDRVLLVELYLLAGHSKRLKIALLSVVRFHVHNVNISGLSREIL